MIGDDIEHRTFERALGGDDGFGGGIDLGDCGVGDVGEDILVGFGKSVAEVDGLGLDGGVRIEHDDFGAALFAFQVICNGTSALIGSGWAAIGRLRDGHHEGLLFGHGSELVFQQECLWASLPSVRGEVTVIVACWIDEVDAGRQHQLIEGIGEEIVADFDGDFFGSGVNGEGFTLNDVDATFGLEIAIAQLDTAHWDGTGDHQIGQDASVVAGITVNQSDIDVAAPKFEVFGDGGTAEATADDKHMRWGSVGTEGTVQCE